MSYYFVYIIHVCTCVGVCECVCVYTSLHVCVLGGQRRSCSYRQLQPCRWRCYAERLAQVFGTTS